MKKKLDKYYKSRIHSGSIIIVKPTKPEDKSDEFDYKVLFMKRNEKLSYGGFYAFSGGKIE